MWGRVLGVGVRGVRLGAVMVVVVAWCLGACPRCRVSGGSAQCSGGGGGDGVVVCGGVSVGWSRWCGGLETVIGGGVVGGVGLRGLGGGVGWSRWCGGLDSVGRRRG